jgi:hypothetical protein
LLTTGIKVIDLICPFLKGGKVGRSAARRRQDRRHHGADQQRRQAARRRVGAGVGERT